jgi:hypothetical protein
METGMQSESIQGMRPRKGMRPLLLGQDDSCQFAFVDHSSKYLHQNTPVLRIEAPLRPVACDFLDQEINEITPATIAEIVAQNRSCRWSHASVDIAAARSAYTYIDTAAIQAIDSASAANSPLRLRRRPRFNHTRYAVSNTGAFASHRLVTWSMCGRLRTNSLPPRITSTMWFRNAGSHFKFSHRVSEWVRFKIHARRVKPSALQSSLPTPWWTKKSPSGSYLRLISSSLG